MVNVIIETDILMNVPAMFSASGYVTNIYKGDVSMSILSKKCSKCGEIKAVSEFYTHIQKPDGYSYNCKACELPARQRYAAAHKKENSERGKKWRLENHERVIANGREYYRQNAKALIAQKLKYYTENPEQDVIKKENRRARKDFNGGKVSYKEWVGVLQKYNHQCLCCGRSDIRLTMDHIVPLSLGGRHSVDNIQPLCRSCNSKKYTKIIDYRPPEHEAT